MTDKMGGAQTNPLRFRRLRQFRQNCDLMNVPTTENQFTWRKNRSNSNNTFEKLDRVLISSMLTNIFPHFKIKYHPFTVSDHCLVTFNLGATEAIQKPPFRFDIGWADREDYSDLVKKV